MEDAWEWGVHVNLLYFLHLFSWGTSSPSTPPCSPPPVTGVTYLENTHAKGIAQDLVGLIVVAVANVCGSYKELKGIILLYVQRPILNFFLQLSHSFLPVTANTPIP